MDYYNLISKKQMTNIKETITALIQEKVTDIVGANSSWSGSYDAALKLYAIDGDWQDKIEWMVEVLQDNDFEMVEYDFIEEALHAMIEKNAYTVDDVLSSFYVDRMDTSELFELTVSSCNDEQLVKLAALVAEDDVDLFFETEVWTNEEKLALVKKAVELELLSEDYLAEFEDEDF